MIRIARFAREPLCALIAGTRQERPQDPSLFRTRNRFFSRDRLPGVMVVVDVDVKEGKVGGRDGGYRGKE